MPACVPDWLHFNPIEFYLLFLHTVFQLLASLFSSGLACCFPLFVHSSSLVLVAPHAHPTPLHSTQHPTPLSLHNASPNPTQCLRRFHADTT